MTATSTSDYLGNGPYNNNWMWRWTRVATPLAPQMSRASDARTLRRLTATADININNNMPARAFACRRAGSFASCRQDSISRTRRGCFSTGVIEMLLFLDCLVGCRDFWRGDACRLYGHMRKPQLCRFETYKAVPLPGSRILYQRKIWVLMPPNNL